MSACGTEEPCLSRSPAWLKLKELRTPFEGLGSPQARRSLTPISGSARISFLGHPAMLKPSLGFLKEDDGAAGGDTAVPPRRDAPDPFLINRRAPDETVSIIARNAGCCESSTRIVSQRSDVPQVTVWDLPGSLCCPPGPFFQRARSSRG